MLFDAGDVIIHLFRPEVREFYNLEKMWNADLPNVGTSHLLTVNDVKLTVCAVGA